VDWFLVKQKSAHRACVVPAALKRKHGNAAFVLAVPIGSSRPTAGWRVGLFFVKAICPRMPYAA
jgi:hypothetical protein